ncbi:LysR family transcriptional regulator [Vibrio breoganii]|uniref:LysR family transcriptional regulator n=1 Tax=Vibrio breoganii TaxID=553239 RepID=UPI000C83EA42|nr:LysR family transcriptional regulator [Vibrio breoganii]PML96654.1 LysR family transcriptional regulator [Vibrio breoganii]PMN57347.1 LysR family transcriptional regulator [Vibrio breoganii]
MAKQFYNNLDLNLLRTFQVIYQEKNLKRASLRLHVSAPALSKSLTRLRDHFHDPLFVKVPKGLNPTPFANELADSISPTLEKLANNLNSLNDFSPSDLQGRMTIAISSFMLQAIGTDLFSILHEEAPDIQWHLVNWSKTSLEDIAKGDIKLGINYDIDLSRKDISSRKITQDRFQIIVRKDHPIAGNKVSVKTLSMYPVAALIVADWNTRKTFAEKVFGEFALIPKVVLRSELPSVVLETIARTDLIFPHSGLFDITRYPHLKALTVWDREAELLKDIHIYSNQKDRNDATKKWLQKIITTLLKKQR